MYASWYPRKRRHTRSRWKSSQELKWKIISFLAEYIHAKMAGRKSETYQRKPRMHALFMFELDWTMNAQSLKTISDYRNMVLAATWLDGRKGRSQQDSYVITNSFIDLILFKQGVARTGRHRTGPPCSVGRSTANAPNGRPVLLPTVLQRCVLMPLSHAPGGRPAAGRQRYRRRQTTDDDDIRQPAK